MRQPSRAFAAGQLLLLLGLVLAPLPAQNLITNPGFETGDFTGWFEISPMQSFVEAANPPQFVPNNGGFLTSIFGQFSGIFNVTGIFQGFGASPGEAYEMDCWSRHFSGDALMGGGAPNANWAIMKIAFFNNAGQEITGFEQTILDGTFPVDVWNDNPPVQGVAPAGTTQVQALILFLQPAVGGGALHVDDVSFRRIPLTHTITQDSTTLDLTIALSQGEAFAQYGIFYSVDPANGLFPNVGNWGGLHIPASDLLTQINLVLGGVPFFGGNLDAGGASSFQVPGAALGGLTGFQFWSVGVQLNGMGMLDFSNVESTTLL